MKMMVSVKWVIRCTLLLACSTLAAPRLGLRSPNLDLETPLDQDSFNYLIPRQPANYKTSLTWNDVVDPRLYLYGDSDVPEEAADSVRYKRIPQLSIDSPIETLRQRLRLEIAREVQEKARQQREKQVERNRAFLDHIGKRSLPDNQNQQDKQEQHDLLPDVNDN